MKVKSHSTQRSDSWVDLHRKVISMAREELASGELFCVQSQGLCDRLEWSLAGISLKRWKGKSWEKRLFSVFYQLHMQNWDWDCQASPLLTSGLLNFSMQESHSNTCSFNPQPTTCQALYFYMLGIRGVTNQTHFCSQHLESNEEGRAGARDPRVLWGKKYCAALTVTIR